MRRSPLRDRMLYADDVAAAAPTMPRGLLHRILMGLLAFVVVVPNLSFRTRAIGEAGLDWQNGLKLVIWITLFVVAVFCWRRYRALFSDWMLALALCYAGFGLLSSLYSVAPAYSAACAFGFLAYLLFAALLAADFDGRTLVAVVAWSFSGYLAVTWIAAILAPDTAFLPTYGDNQLFPRLQGLSGHPNMLGKQVASFICFILAASALNWFASRQNFWVIMALAVITLVATDSRTSLLALLLSVAVVTMRTHRMGGALLGVAGVAVGLVTVADGLGLPVLAGLFEFGSRTGEADEVMSLTGRVRLWGFVWENFLDRPLFGYGYNSTELVLARNWYGPADQIVGAHNTMLQSLLTLGIVGTVPLLAMYLLMIHRFFSSSLGISRYLIPYSIIVSLTEIEIASVPVLMMLVIFLAFSIDAVERRKLRRTAGPRLKVLVKELAP
jgi:O-antigen ligase